MNQWDTKSTRVAELESVSCDAEMGDRICRSLLQEEWYDVINVNLSGEIMNGR